MIWKILTALFCSGLVLGSSIWPFSAFAVNLEATEALATSREQGLAVTSDNLLRGVVIRTEQAKDLSANAVATEDSLKKELDEMLETAWKSGLNAVFYEVKPSAQLMAPSRQLPAVALYSSYDMVGSFDSLAYALERAQEIGLQLYAVVDPYQICESAELERLMQSSGYQKIYKNRVLQGREGDILLDPTTENTLALLENYCLELLENYNLDGLVLKDLYRLDILQLQRQSNRNFGVELVSRLRGFVPEEGKKVPELGLLGSAEAQSTYTLYQNMETLGLIDFVLPVCAGSPEGGYQAYVEQLHDALGSQSTVATVNELSVQKFSDSMGFLGEQHQMGYQLYINSLYGMDGFVLDSYRNLSRHQEQVAQDAYSDYAVLLEAVQQAGIGIGQQLMVYKPEDGFSTTYEQYFLAGTSDPEQPLTMNGEPVERFGTLGTFGVLAELAPGENRFVFEQGEESVERVITRVTSSSPTKISIITQSSIYPKTDDILFAGQVIPLSCNGPADGRVTASFAGQTVVLEQAAPAETGTVVNYTGKLMMPESSSSDGAVNLGPVTYTLTYQGSVSEYTSAGSLFTAAEDEEIKVEVTTYRANVLEDYTVSGEFVTTLSEGCTDLVELLEPEIAYFRLSSGGYISKGDVKILEGRPEIENQVDWAEHQVLGSLDEELRLSGTAMPPFHARVSEDGTVLTVSLYNTRLGETGMPSMENSEIVDLLEANQSAAGSELRFVLKKPIWGYDVYYDKGDTVIFLKGTPVLNPMEALPLAGATIVLDPGHGATDCGALGVVGSTGGATESDLNYIVALVTKLRLEQLGASVYLSRGGSEFLSLDERMILTEALKPDLFLSVHHNSIVETVDANLAKGTEAYYHTDYSQALAENLLTNVTAAVDRNPRGAYQGYYRVTRVTCAPAVLLEVGFVPNPAEYEKLCDPYVIIQTANGICQGIIDTIGGSAE